MLDDKSRFPITLWPGLPLPAIPVQRWGGGPDDRGNLHWHGPIELVELPEEWVLRDLADADLDDDDALVALLRFHGAIRWPYFAPAVVPVDRHPYLGHIPTLQEQKAAHWWEQHTDATVEDARWWLKTARALARAWGDADMGRDSLAAWDAEGFVNLTDEQWSWAQFTFALNVGLQPFRARVEHPPPVRGGGVLGAPNVDLYSAACLQVFNFAANKDTARRCENETCGRMFVHQLGGAEHGQHRTKGLLRFCTPECARAETQRQYRRRKAALNEEQQ